VGSGIAYCWRSTLKNEDELPVGKILLAGGIRSYVIVALGSYERAPGTLAVGSTAPYRYSTEDVRVLEEVGTHLTSLLVGLGSLAAGVFFLSVALTDAQPAAQYPLDDKLANEPAPWSVPGKWGKRGNWGRWGENDKREMLNYITQDMIVKAAGLVKQGKVYELGEELHADVPRVITPQRMGIQIMQDRDGYDRVAAQSGAFDPKRYQVGASFTFMHNHTGAAVRLLCSRHEIRKPDRFLTHAEDKYGRSPDVGPHLPSHSPDRGGARSVPSLHGDRTGPCRAARRGQNPPA
jgi:hypothetical protein